MSDLPQRDTRVTWHPYTQHGVEAAPLPVVGARGAWLELADGRKLLDAISSWWATLHGHSEPVLVEAMHAQARRLDHVLFAGATHEPAVELAEGLLKVVPAGLSRVFYSDDGSTAVEAGMKMVLQSWVHRREPGRRVFIALEGAYHGDTFGAMAAGDPDPFFTAFAPLLFEVRRVKADAESLAVALDELGGRAAGFLLEPMLQGAAGMRVMTEQFVREARALCTEHGVPLLADEVMTGFGRTGALFACGRAGITPDVLCLAKGLSGGMLPLAATVATEELFECFLHDERSRFFPHGHTFTANPVACAVGVASLRMTLEREVPARLDAIGGLVHEQLLPLASDPRVRDIRHLGGMAALDLVVPEGDGGYLSSRAPTLRRAAIEHGVLLRPLGDVLYALPPACTTDDEARRIGQTMRALVEAHA
ncbi:MAG: adenosylmethionine--8-amino-7-oxononanoate transaminase [Planctomycetota bacterium]|nr:adenosylmethionine--8-amino-7-oxononanoate transaminase [Planctomycetota bacterium]MEC8653128.1 adenosylmethionine--8-amino-7-oxononanoate transaminase [Planctomycetota bacterium]